MILSFYVDLVRAKGLDTGTFENFTIDNFEFHTWPSRTCDKERIVRLDPCACSDDTFFIDKNDSTIDYKKDVLRNKVSGKVYSNYCILFNKDSTHAADVCLDDESATYSGDK